MVPNFRMMRYKYLKLLIVILILTISCASKILPVSSEELESEDQFNNITELIFLTDSKRLVGSVASPYPEFHGSIRLWNIDNGNLEKIIYRSAYIDGEYQNVGKLKLSHNGQLLAFAEISGSSDSLVKSLGCYSLKNNILLWKDKWKKHTRQEILDILFMSDDSKIIAAGEKKTVTYDAKSGNILNKKTKLMEKYPRRGYRLLGTVMSPDSQYIVIWYQPLFLGHSELFTSFRLNRDITVWDLVENKMLKKSRKPKELCSAIFTPDEKSILFGTTDGSILQFLIEKNEWVNKWEVEAGNKRKYVDDIKLSNDQHYLAIKTAFDIKIINYQTNTVVNEFNNVVINSRSCWVYPMAFSPDNKYFAFEKRGRLCLYDTETWDEKWCVPSWSEDKPLSE